MAMPFRAKAFSFTQPDGTSIALRGWGDQHHAVFETLDGYTVTKNPATGFYEVARVSPDGRTLEPASGARAGLARGLRIDAEASRIAGRDGALRFGGRRCDERRRERKAARRAFRAAAAAGGPVLAPPQRTTVGDYIGLTLLIDFSDTPQTIARDEVDRFCNQVGYGGFGNNGSVRDYFLANSIGRCRYTNVVAPYFRAPRPKSFYTDPSIPMGTRARQLIGEALAHWKANGFDFTPLTADGQGFVYALNVFYAGPVVNNWSEGLWPHAWQLGTAVPLAPGRAAFDYQFTAIGDELELGTFCHENGHMLCDYPDLYDYGNESSGVGGYCLMCGGANLSEKNPTQISAYLKRLSGWAESVTPLAPGQQVTLSAQGNHFAMLAKDDKEYFLLENRARAGRDAALPDEGLAIWHVDEDGDNSNEQMTAASHYELSLEQADGRFELERQRGGLGDVNDLYGAGGRFDATSTPSSRWWDGTASNLTISSVSAPGANVSFRVGSNDVVVPPGVLRRESAPGRAIPDNRAEGVTDTLHIAEAKLIATSRIGVDIAHTYRADLRVALVTPWGAEIVLHAREGGSADDLRTVYDEANRPVLAGFRGRSVQGAWKLIVQDLAPADTGTLAKWSLEFGTVDAPDGPTVLQESPGIAIPDHRAAGVERSIATAAPGNVASVEVALDISHTWIADLRVRLRSPAGTEVILHDGEGGSSDNIVRSYTAATTPALAGLAGQPIAGSWRLLVADTAAEDTGKLNGWKLTIR